MIYQSFKVEPNIRATLGLPLQNMMILLL